MPLPPFKVDPSSNDRKVLTALAEGHGCKCERVETLLQGHIVAKIKVRFPPPNLHAVLTESASRVGQCCTCLHVFENVLCILALSFRLALKMSHDTAGPYYLNDQLSSSDIMRRSRALPSLSMIGLFYGQVRLPSPISTTCVLPITFAHVFEIHSKPENIT